MLSSRCFAYGIIPSTWVREMFTSRTFLYIVSIFLPIASFIETSAFAQTGIASVYSLSSGSKTANGERLNPNALTAAHRTLAFGTKVRVVHAGSGRSVVVTINDRGPFVHGRIIDLTPAAAHVLGFSGLAHVTLEATK
jgi:rare lipoprotein A